MFLRLCEWHTHTLTHMFPPSPPPSCRRGIVLTTQVNLITSFNVVKASVKAMIKEEGELKHQQGATGSSTSSSTSSSPNRRGGGSIVLVSAALASHGIPNYEAMSAAKAAVEGEEGRHKALQGWVK